MKSKQVLDVQQMQHLQELGLKLKPSLVHYYKIINIDSGKWYLSVTIGDISEDSPTYQYIPAYTLQDVLELLPKEIKPAEKCYWLRIDLADECLYYYRDAIDLTERRGKVFSYYGEELIDAAYNALCWCIEQGYVKTDKEDKE